MEDSDNVDSDIIAQKFMERFQLDEDQFAVIAMFLGLMSRKTDFTFRAKSLKTTRADLEDLRSRILDTRLTLAKMMDKEDEETGDQNITMTDQGIGVFKHERITRAVNQTLDGMSAKEAAERAEIKQLAVELLRDSFEHQLLYMGALALKQNPTWTALDIIRELSEMEGYVTWNDLAVEYLDEDDDAALAEEQEDSESEDTGSEDPDNKPDR